MTDHERRINEAHSWADRDVRRLTNAVVVQAAREYLRAATILARPDPTATDIVKRQAAKRRVREIDIFFASDWFRQISDIDPAALREKLLQMAKAAKKFPRGVKMHD
jgi:hypothetical protein